MNDTYMISKFTTQIYAKNDSLSQKRWNKNNPIWIGQR